MKDKTIYNTSAKETKKIIEGMSPKERFVRNPQVGFYPGKLGLFALAVFYCGGDMVAAALLIYLQYRWRSKAKFKRLDKEWIVMTAEEWAFASGLTKAQFHKRALPRLRNKPFVEIKQGKITSLDKNKKMFMRLIPEELPLTYGDDWERFVCKHYYNSEWHGYEEFS